MFHGVIGAQCVCWQSIVFTLRRFTTTDNSPIFEACYLSCDFLRFLLQKMSYSASAASIPSALSSFSVFSYSLGGFRLGSLSEKLNGRVSTLLYGFATYSQVFFLVMRSLMALPFASKRSLSANSLSLSQLTEGIAVLTCPFSKQRLRQISLLLNQMDAQFSRVQFKSGEWLVFLLVRNSLLMRSYYSFQIQLHRFFCLFSDPLFFILISLLAPSGTDSKARPRLMVSYFLSMRQMLGERQGLAAGLSGDVLNLLEGTKAGLFSNFCLSESMTRSSCLRQRLIFISIMYNIMEWRVSDQWELRNSQRLNWQSRGVWRWWATFRRQSSLVASRKEMQSCFSMMSCSGAGFVRRSTALQSVSRKKSCARTYYSVSLRSGSFSMRRRSRSRKARLMYPILALTLELMRLFSMEVLYSSKGRSGCSSAQKGFSRNISSNINTPNDQISAFWPNCPFSASGAMYSSVPTKVSTDCSCSTMTFERPQSVSLRCPSSVTSRFSGFSQRQMSPQLWRMPTPTTISARMPRMVGSVKGISFLRRQKQRSPLGRYSMMMQTRDWFWKVSRMPTRKSWRPMRCISSHCSTLNSRIFDFSIIFIANNRPLSFSSASTTHPNAPRPKYFLLWQSSGPRPRAVPTDSPGVRVSEPLAEGRREGVEWAGTSLIGVGYGSAGLSLVQVWQQGIFPIISILFHEISSTQGKACWCILSVILDGVPEPADRQEAEGRGGEPDRG